MTDNSLDANEYCKYLKEMKIKTDIEEKEAKQREELDRLTFCRKTVLPIFIEKYNSKPYSHYQDGIAMIRIEGASRNCGDVIGEFLKLKKWNTQTKPYIHYQPYIVDDIYLQSDGTAYISHIGD